MISIDLFIEVFIFLVMEDLIRLGLFDFFVFWKTNKGKEMLRYILKSIIKLYINDL